jgi:hypothetical protein
MIHTSEAAAPMADSIIVEGDDARPLTTRGASTPPATGCPMMMRSNAAARPAARRTSDAGAAMLAERMVG